MPEADTWKVALPPCGTMMFVGCRVKVGGKFVTTLVTFVLELLAVAGSSNSEPTVTILVTEPTANGVTVIVTPLESPAFIAPMLQITMPLVKTHPGDAEEKATFA